MPQSSPHPRASGVPFLRYRDRDRREHTHVLDAARRALTIGRGHTADISLPWDDEVSRLHARVELVGDDPAADWTVVDDLSRNGSFLNGKRIRGRARLSAGDTITIGNTAISFHAPTTGEGDAGPATGAPHATASSEEDGPGFDPLATSIAKRPVTRDALSDTQRRVLSALARPYRATGESRPATDTEIAAELFLGVETVRVHLSKLFRQFDLEAIPEDQRRKRLVERALLWGLIPEAPLPPRRRDE